MAIRKITYDLLRGHVGADVARLQRTLNETMEEGLVVDGVYGANTSRAVKNLQAKFNLTQNGECSGETLKKARDLGFHAVEFSVGNGNDDWNWPPRPSSAKLKAPSAAHTTALFGSFDFVHDPAKDNPQRIRIRGSWQSDNIKTINVPQLIGVPIPIDDAHAMLSDGRLQCHRLAENRILELFAAWESEGLVDRILTFYGAFNARLKRKRFVAKAENLSNHSWGTAFDITAKQNWLGAMPAVMGQRGCIRELVPIANDLGFFWGGHFGGAASVSGRDGMHFELAKL